MSVCVRVFSEFQRKNLLLFFPGHFFSQVHKISHFSIIILNKNTHKIIIHTATVVDCPNEGNRQWCQEKAAEMYKSASVDSDTNGD